MRNMTEAEMTDVVLQRYANTPDPRLRTIMHSLIRLCMRSSATYG
ncbi:hypothetical protein AWB81_05689 [Caballeronia arationis]|jgi:catechol 1,2-dioxygenase|nr:hypothetical protein [Caballeronia arationis]SAK99198.1 hypothetical protein AWB81_05689 [Caballeronia arationis]